MAWDTTAIWFFVTSGTTSWTYNATPVSWNSGDNYLIQSKAEDDASNVETASVGISFIFDNADPSSALVLPLNGITYNSLGTITGTAGDVTAGVNLV